MSDKSDQESADKRERFVLWAMLGGGGVLFTLTITAMFIYALGDNWEQRGQFGDMFGAANALFSSLAFVGVIATIGIQSREFALMVKDQKESADALKEQLNAQLQAAQMQAIGILIDDANRRLKEIGEPHSNDSSAHLIGIRKNLYDELQEIRLKIKIKTDYPPPNPEKAE